MALAHPHGVQPWGNFFLGPKLNIRPFSLGSLSALDDELLLEVLGRCDATCLAQAQLASHALYCFCAHEDLWRTLVLQELEGHFEWAGTWQRTYAAARAPSLTPGKRAAQRLPVEEVAAPAAKRSRTRQGTGDAAGAAPGAGAVASLVQRKGTKRRVEPWAPLSVRGLYSDLLYQPWLCAKVDIAPEWLEVDNVDRRSKLSLAQFREQYEVPNRPVVITDIVEGWAATRRWTREYLADALGGRKVLAGGYEMDFGSYLRYSDGQSDEMPLYLFDKAFASKAPALAADYTVPEYFQEDMFSVLGSVWRPDYRWLIMGPARSGSSFHVDPNATSAWNACVTGAKKWILYPPGCVPPGVHPSADGADVAAPVSIGEWYLNFYAATREGKVPPVECVVRAGELLFVPRGWWHCAWNLEESIAVTQNYVGATNLPAVLTFLRSGRRDLVSGCAMEDREDLHERFVEALRRERPQVLQRLEADEAVQAARLEDQRKLSALFRAPTVAAVPERPRPTGDGCLWADHPASAAAGGSGKAAAVPFTFGFSV